MHYSHETHVVDGEKQLFDYRASLTFLYTTVIYNQIGKGTPLLILNHEVYIVVTLVDFVQFYGIRALMQQTLDFNFLNERFLVVITFINEFTFPDNFHRVILSRASHGATRRYRLLLDLFSLGHIVFRFFLNFENARLPALTELLL